MINNPLHVPIFVEINNPAHASIEDLLKKTPKQAGSKPSEKKQKTNASKVVLITGSSSGIGLAVSEYLGAKGYKVYASCRSPDKAQSLKKICEKYKNIKMIPLDVTSSDSVNKAVKTILNEEKTIDAVVNNAGMAIFGPSETLSPEEVNRLFDTNVTGVLRVNQAVVPIMRKNKKGVIINMGSESAVKASAALPVYSATKSALESLTATDAARYAQWNIRETLLQPPHIQSKLDQKASNGTYFDGKENPYNDLSQERKAWEKRMAEGKSPIEVAKTIEKIIESKKTNLWVQTNPKVTANVARYFTDPTGNNRRAKIIITPPKEKDAGHQNNKVNQSLESSKEAKQINASKVILITGSSSGIGLSVSEYLGAKGYKVYASCRSPDKAEDLKKICDKYKNIKMITLDVTSSDSVNKAVKTILDEEKTIDVVVNNAGITIFGPSETHSPEEVNRLFDTNVTGVLRVNQAVVPIMRQNKSGNIINIGSESAVKASAALPVYSATKSAVESLTATDAARYAKWNIRETLLQPPHIQSKLDQKASNGTYFDGKENPYEDLDKERKAWEKRMEGGNSPFEVGKTIEDIIKSKATDLWVQTNPKVTANVALYFTDPTGNNRRPKIMNELPTQTSTTSPMAGKSALRLYLL